MRSTSCAVPPCRCCWSASGSRRLPTRRERAKPARGVRTEATPVRTPPLLKGPRLLRSDHDLARLPVDVSQRVEVRGENLVLRRHSNLEARHSARALRPGLGREVERITPAA